MDELVKLVMEKTNMGEAQAQQAVSTVIGFLKQRLPAPIAGQLDAALANENTMKQATDALDKGVSALSGIIGKKR